MRLLIALAVLPVWLWANTAPEIEVTGLSQSGAGASKAVTVDFRYRDAEGDGLTISVRASADAGATYDVVPVASVSGDTQVQATSTYQSGSVTWTAGLDWPSQYSSQMKLKLEALDNPGGTPADMVLIPAGSFQMGFDAVDPSISVSTSAFYMGKHEVTWELWQAVYQWAGNNGYDFENPGLGRAGSHPVHTVNWYDVVKWSNARSEREGLTPVYYVDTNQTQVYRSGAVDVAAGAVSWSATGYRLPTEVELEKGARGGLIGKRFPWGDTITHVNANYQSYESDVYDVSSTRGFHPDYDTAPPPYTSPVGIFPANGYGLHDMAGNLHEWCWDWAGSYPDSESTDATGPVSGSQRMLRGGNWGSGAESVRCSYRSGYGPGNEFNGLGFRLVRTASP